MRKNHLPEERQKSYEAVAHDVILWHLVKDKRPAYVESPLDAKDWILTVDFRLIRFDERKLRTSRIKHIPLCLHPTSLIQLLQFWVPRTQKFEEAVLGSMRLPFLFQEFDAQAERISLTIISRLGRFEGSETIPQQTLVNVALNDSLRDRISHKQSEEEQSELVRDALVEEMRLQKQQKEAESKELEATLKSKKAESVSLQEQVTKKDKTVAEISRQLEEKQNNLALLTYLGLLGVMIVLSFAAVWLVDLLFPLPQSTLKSILAMSAGGIFAFIVLHRLFEFIKFHNQKMKQLWLFTKVRKFRKWLLGPVFGGLILSLLGDVIWSIMDL